MFGPDYNLSGIIMLPEFLHHDFAKLSPGRMLLEYSRRIKSQTNQDNILSSESQCHFSEVRSRVMILHHKIVEMKNVQDDSSALHAQFYCFI